MPKTVEVPDLGVIEFPDNTPDDEISSAISDHLDRNVKKAAMASEMTSLRRQRMLGDAAEGFLGGAEAGTSTVAWMSPFAAVARAADALGLQSPIPKEHVKQVLDAEGKLRDYYTNMLPKAGIPEGTPIFNPGNITPEEQQQTAEGIKESVAEQVSGLTRPDQLALLVAGAKYPEAIARMFQTEAITSLPNAIQNVRNASARGDIKGTSKAMADLTVQAAVPAAIEHGIPRTEIPVLPERVVRPPVTTEVTPERTPIPVPKKSSAIPEVPSTPPEPMKGVSVIEEIRNANAQTKEAIRALYPQISREEAAALRKQAWGETAAPIPEPKASEVSPAPERLQQTGEPEIAAPKNEGQVNDLPIGEGEGTALQGREDLPQEAPVTSREIKPLKTGEVPTPHDLHGASLEEFMAFHDSMKAPGEQRSAVNKFGASLSDQGIADAEHLAQLSRDKAREIFNDEGDLDKRFMRSMQENQRGQFLDEGARTAKARKAVSEGSTPAEAIKKFGVPASAVEDLVTKPAEPATPAAPATPEVKLGVWPESEWSAASLAKQTPAERLNKAKFLGLRWPGVDTFKSSPKALADAAKKRIEEIKAAAAKPKAVEASSETAKSDTQDLVDKFENGDIETFDDFVNEVNARAAETGDDKIIEAVRDWQDFKKEDFEQLAGRGDRDAAESKFLADIGAKSIAPEIKAEPQSAGKSLPDTSAIENAKTLQEHDAAVGNAITKAKTAEEMQHIQKVAKQTLPQVGQPLIDVPRGTKLLSGNVDEAGHTQAPTDSITAASKLIRNLKERESTSPELINLISGEGLSNPTLTTKMKSGMLSALHDSKIFDTIIRLVPVDVVNDLIGKKGSSEMGFKDKSMLLDFLSANPHSPVSLRFFESVRSAITRAATIFSNPDTAGPNVKPSPTEAAVHVAERIPPQAGVNESLPEPAQPARAEENKVALNEPEKIRIVHAVGEPANRPTFITLDSNKGPGDWRAKADADPIESRHDFLEKVAYRSHSDKELNDVLDRLEANLGMPDAMQVAHSVSANPHGSKVTRARALKIREDVFKFLDGDLEEAPATGVTEDHIRSAFPDSEVRKSKIKWTDGPEGDGYVVKLPNGKTIIVDPFREHILFNVDEIAKEHGISVEDATGAIARGKYRPEIDGQGVIELLKSADPSTLSHEKFHALMDMVFSDADRAAILKRYGTEEKAADAFRRSEGFTRGFGDKIKAFVERLGRNFRGDVFPTTGPAPATKAPESPTSAPKAPSSSNLPTDMAKLRRLHNSLKQEMTDLELKFPPKGQAIPDDLQEKHNAVKQKFNEVHSEIVDRLWSEEKARMTPEPPPSEPKITNKVLKAQKENLLEQVDKAIQEAPDHGPGKITISVPGDGDFTIRNVKPNLKAFREQAAKEFPATVGKMTEPGLASGKAKPIPKATKAPSIDETIKAAAKFVSNEPTREAINTVFSNGSQMVATDGRQLIRIWTDKAPGTPEKPVRLNEAGKPVDTDSIFPNYNAVIDPNPSLVLGGMETDQLWKQARQAQVFKNTYDNPTLGLDLVLNPDRTLGARMEQKGGDVFEHNVQKGALNLGTYNADFLVDQMDAARKLGNEKVDVYFHKDGTEGPIGFVGQNHESILMPMRGAVDEKGTYADLHAKASDFPANLVGARAHPRPTREVPAPKSKKAKGASVNISPGEGPKAGITPDPGLTGAIGDLIQAAGEIGGQIGGGGMHAALMPATQFGNGTLGIGNIWRNAPAKLKSLWGGFAMHELPDITRSDRATGEAGVRYAASPLVARTKGTMFAGKVLEGLKPEMDLKLGVALSEDNLRSIRKGYEDEAKQALAEGGILKAQKAKENADNVTTLVGQKNSPFKSEKEYQAFLKSPEAQTAIARHNALWEAEKDPLYRQANDLDPDLELETRGEQTGARVNLKHVMPGEATKTTVGRLAKSTLIKQTATLLRRDPFAIRAKGSGTSYEGSYTELMAHGFEREYPVAMQHEFIRSLIEAGDAVLSIREYPKGLEIKGEPTKAYLMKLKPFEGRFLQVRKSLAPEYQAVTGLDPALRLPIYSKVADFLTRQSVQGIAEGSNHIANIFTQAFTGLGPTSNPLLNSLIKVTGRPDVLWTLPKIAIKAFTDQRQRMLDLATIGATKEGFKGGLGLGRLINHVDQGVRVVSDDVFKGMAREGWVENTETERRHMVNQVGQYAKRLQPTIIRALRDTGINPFATATHTFMLQGIREITLNPGVKAPTIAAAAALRVEKASGWMGLIVAVAFMNYMLSGKVMGPKGTKLLSVGWKDKDGKLQTFDVGKLTGYGRALDRTGIGPAIEAHRQGLAPNTQIKKGIQAVGNTGVSYLAGPLNRFADVAITGSRPGVPQVQESPLMPPRDDFAPLKSQTAANIKTALLQANPLIDVATSSAQGKESKEVVAKQLSRYVPKSGLNERTIAALPKIVKAGEMNEYVDGLAKQLRKLPREQRWMQAQKTLADSEMAPADRSRALQLLKRKRIFSFE